MTAEEKANELMTIFNGDKEIIAKVIDQMLERDKKWIYKLAKEEPDLWQISDFNKSLIIYEELTTKLALL